MNRLLPLLALLLIVAACKKSDSGSDLPENTWTLDTSTYKAVYVNRPVVPNQYQIVAATPNQSGAKVEHLTFTFRGDTRPAAGRYRMVSDFSGAAGEVICSVSTIRPSGSSYIPNLDGARDAVVTITPEGNLNIRAIGVDVRNTVSSVKETLQLSCNITLR